MQRNDKLAVREALDDHGALLDAVLDACGADADARDGLLLEIGRALWGTAAVTPSPALDERPLLLSCALAAVPAAALNGSASMPCS